jgi:predicted RNA binding protein YcfA (HicA-like mRNA interferase family)
MADKLPVLKAKEVVHALLRGDFYIHHQAGSQARLLHRTRPELRVTIPIHSKDIPPSLLRRILKQAGLTDDEFAKLV